MHWIGQVRVHQIDSFAADACETPDEVRFIVYDAKRNEFMSRGNWPYLLQPVIVETGSFLLALEELRKEFDERVQALSNGAPVPRIVVVADEYSDLMVADGDKANSLLADMLALGRSAGVHFIFATSREDEVVMSQPLRCGFLGRIAFKVAFEEDSRIIIGENGADRLNGRGDFLSRDATGLHCGRAPYISDEDFERLCTY